MNAEPVALVASVAQGELLKGIVDSSPVVILALDVDANVILWNAAAERTFGYAEADVLGGPHPVVPFDQREKFEALFARVLSGERFRDKPVHRMRKDGERLELSASGAPLHDEEGRLLGAVFVVVDVTEQRRVEQQLRHAQKMEALGQLTGGVAHDFNNVLQVVLGAADIVGPALADGSAEREMLQLAEEAAERGVALIRQLLAFARKQPLEAEALDVNDVVSRLLRLLAQTLEGQCVLSVEATPDLPRALIDRNQLESALVNLVVNARDAMPRGGEILIETSLIELDEHYAAGHPGVRPGAYVAVAVSDEGEGMPGDVAARAFDPFFTTKPKGKGTGLGLSMVYGLMKQSGGHVTLYSEPGQGTTLRLYLPLADGSATSRSGVGDAVSPQRSRGEVILLVEDEEGVRRFAAIQLRTLGYTVLEAPDGKEALTLLERSDVDLLFTDVMLPGGVNGRQLAVEAGRLRPNLKVLYASGYSEALATRMGVLKPGAELLAKPYRAADLASRLRKLLDGA